MSSSLPIKHVFVLMLENRSFDHMFGFSGLQGTTPDGEGTKINGLDEANPPSNNDCSGKPYKAEKGALNSMPIDPGHEFIDVLEQQCGENAAKHYQPGQYPDFNQYTMGGFVTDYQNSQSDKEGKATKDLVNIMRCYDTKTQLPVIYELAKNFAICDNWFSSLPGPTWPNRFFAHGGSSSGMDDSPSNPQILQWMLTGFRFPNGSIFDALKKQGWAVYKGKKGSHPLSDIAMVGSLAGVHVWDIKNGENFASDVQNPNYKYAYTFIEPNYGDVIGGYYEGGSSQHPVDSVIGGEQLIKDTYDAIRRSPIWESSCLIVTYDEHGGFFDHVAPGPAPPVNDSVWSNGSVNQHKFKFDRYGIRVPAIVASPYTKAGTIDHTLYDHTTIIATLRDIFKIQKPLSNRDANANTLRKLFPLTTPRTDCPKSLPSPASQASFASIDSAYLEEKKREMENAKSNKLTGNGLGVLQIAIKQKFEDKYKRPAKEGDKIIFMGADGKPVEITAHIYAPPPQPTPNAHALFSIYSEVALPESEPSVGISDGDMMKLNSLVQTRESANKFIASLLTSDDHKLLEED